MSLDKLTNRRIDEIFSGALAVSGKVRDAFVDAQCGDDLLLKSRVLALLEASQASDDGLARRFEMIRARLWQTLLEEPASGRERAPTAAGEDGEDLSGRRVGAWQIERRIARGGLSTVYRARRADGAFDQTVAFKVLRRGLDTDDLIARFRVERQILFALDHPSIARVYDGGALEDGRPYLVLEYVDGLAITAHCETHGLDIRSRIRLLIDVLNALHHAHQHLVVHRDVKPQNILVTPEGRVALLDFGIAKLLDPEALPGHSTLTRTGVSLLTPGYGSPEQQAGQPVTTASDIYQVGLVLYELLCGKRPFAERAHATGAVPPAPSHHLRGRSAYREVKGDLDAITAKAMHLDPARRYASATEMSADLARYLAGMPVLARPDSWGYRLGKLTRRKPWTIPVAAAAVLTVAAYVVTLTMYSNRLAEQERLAEAARQFMVELFRSPDPYAPADEEAGRNITVVEALELGERRLRTELEGQPALQASLLASISDVYSSLDQNRRAIELREAALALERKLHGDHSEPVLASLRLLGGNYAAIGHKERADAAFDEQLYLAREKYSAEAPELAVAEIASASHSMPTGNFAAAHALLRKAIGNLRKAADRHPQILIDALITSAEQHGMESPEEAFASIEEAAALADRHFGASSLQAALVRVRLASSLTMVGDFESSERHFQAAIPVLEARLGTEHSSTLSALNNLGFLQHQRGDHAAAEDTHSRLLDRQIAKHGPMHRAVADSYQNLASALTRLGRFDDSIPLHRRAYEIYREVLNDRGYLIAFPLLSIAYGELERSDPAAAELAAREALGRLEATVPGTFLEGVARCLVGLALERRGRVLEGQRLVKASHPLMRTGAIPEPYPSLCRLPAL